MRLYGSRWNRPRLVRIVCNQLRCHCDLPCVSPDFGIEPQVFQRRATIAATYGQKALLIDMLGIIGIYWTGNLLSRNPCFP